LRDLRPRNLRCASFALKDHALARGVKQAIAPDLNRAGDPAYLELAPQAIADKSKPRRARAGFTLAGRGAGDMGARLLDVDCQFAGAVLLVPDFQAILGVLIERGDPTVSGFPYK